MRILAPKVIKHLCDETHASYIETAVLFLHLSKHRVARQQHYIERFEQLHSWASKRRYIRSDNFITSSSKQSLGVTKLYYSK